ncbi:MAG: M6 family metalloprotease domain-containing protein [Prevotellaceae bacterium]|jgi:M6 family metalloprotease-like protein|nr:M6 family metalloprotease domain-containing protein [Prevotellaceae bacterium]
MNKFNLLFISLFISVLAYATPAKPTLVKVLQPDGNELFIRLNGDENFHYTTTEDGILIKKNTQNFYEYAIINQNGKISLTGITAKQAKLRTKSENDLLKNLNSDVSLGNLATKIIAERAEIKMQKIKSAAMPAKTNAVGEKGIAILVNFSNNAFVTPNANTAFHNLLNKKGYNVNNSIGSARDYFIATSDSIFQPSFDVYGPYTLPNNMKYYGEDYGSLGNDRRPEQMVMDACSLANTDVDFSQYDTDGDGYVDNVFIFYAGYGQATTGVSSDAIWPHRFVVASQPRFDGVKVYDYACGSELKGNSGSTIEGIGTFCHEFSHVLGLPDLYNTANQYDNNTPGSWDIMDNGCYNGDGDVPAMYSAYEMFYVGWLTPEILTECDNYQLEPLENSPKKAYLVAKSENHNLNGKNPNATEFYMLENRQKISFDVKLPGSGLLVTRINFNSAKWNENTVNNSTLKGVEIINKTALPTLTHTSCNFESAASGNDKDWKKNITQISNIQQITGFKYNKNNCAMLISEQEYDKIKVIYQQNSWKILIENKKYFAEIYNINGILVKSTQFFGETEIINKELQKGVYILKISDLDNKKILFSKVVK